MDVTNRLFLYIILLLYLYPLYICLLLCQLRDLLLNMQLFLYYTLYHLPTANDEVAAIIPGDRSEEHFDHYNIILRLRGGCLKRISHLHPSYSTLHYVLLFPNGEDGWHISISSQIIAERRLRSDKVMQQCYYAYRIQFRPRLQTLLLWGGNLFQQYVVNA